MYIAKNFIVKEVTGSWKIDLVQFSRPPTFALGNVCLSPATGLISSLFSLDPVGFGYQCYIEELYIAIELRYLMGKLSGATVNSIFTYILT